MDFIIKRPAPTTDAGKPTGSLTGWVTRKITWCRWPAYLLPMNRAASVCSSMAKTLSTPTTACSTSTVVWKTGGNRMEFYNEVTFTNRDRVFGICRRPQHHFTHFRGKRDMGIRVAYGACANDPRLSAGSGTPALASARAASGRIHFTGATPAPCSSSACDRGASMKMAGTLTGAP